MCYSMRMRKRPTWEQYALNIASEAADRSVDEFVQVGACALRKDHSIAATGYNGPPADVEIDHTNRDLRRKFTIHAEINCLKYCKVGEIGLLAVTMLPCGACMNAIAAWRVPKVIYYDIYDKDSSAIEMASIYKIELLQRFRKTPSLIKP